MQVTVPEVPCPSNLTRLQYTPIRYDVPAMPLPPVPDPLPDVQRQYEQRTKEEKLKFKEENKPKHSGFFGAIANVVEDVSLQVEKGLHHYYTELDNSVRSTNFEMAQINFYNRFRLPNEPLWREFSCVVADGITWVLGNLYVSDHYLGFYGEKKLALAPGQPPTGHLAFLIPLRNIVSIRLGDTKPNNTSLPPEITLNHGASRPDALMIYTNDHWLHLFYYFWKLKDVFNVIDHAWRNSLQDPSVPPIPIPLQHPLPPFIPIGRDTRVAMTQAKTQKPTHWYNLQPDNTQSSYPQPPAAPGQAYYPPTQSSYPTQQSQPVYPAI